MSTPINDDRLTTDPATRDTSGDLRASLYALAAAVGAVLVIYGIVTEEQIAAWLGIVSAAINVAVGALAYRNTATSTLPGTKSTY